MEINHRLVMKVEWGYSNWARHLSATTPISDLALRKMDATFVFDESPHWRSELSKKTAQFERLSGVIAALIEQSQGLTQSFKKSNEYQERMARELLRFLSAYGDIFGKPETTDSLFNVASKLSATLIELHSFHSIFVSQLEFMFVDPLVKFQEHIRQVNKDTRRNYERASDDYDALVTKLCATGPNLPRNTISTGSSHSSPSKHPYIDLASQVYESKYTCCKAGALYATNLNELDHKKDTFLLDKFFNLNLAISTLYNQGNKLFDSQQAYIAAVSDAIQEKAHEIQINDAASIAANYTLPLSLENKLLSYRRKLGLPMQSMPSIMEHNITSTPTVSKHQNSHMSSQLESEDESCPELEPSRGIIKMKEGYLMKRSKGPMRSWSRRYFYIDPQTSTLMYYSMLGDPESATPIADLRSCEIDETECDDRIYIIKIKSPESSTYLQADNKADLEEWISALESAKASGGADVLFESSNDTMNEKPVVSVQETVRPKRFSVSRSIKNALQRSGSLNKLAALSQILLEDGIDEAEKKLEEQIMSHQLDNLVRVENVSFLNGDELMQTTDKDVWLHARWNETNIAITSTGVFLQYHDKNKKPSQVLRDLSYHSIQPVDPTLFDRPFVCYVVSSTGEMTFYDFNSKFARDSWIALLRLNCRKDTPTYVRDSSNISYRMYYSLRLRVVEGRQLEYDCSASTTTGLYGTIVLDQRIKGFTFTDSTRSFNPFWREDFILDDIARPQLGFAVVLHYNKNKKVQGFGKVFIPAKSIRLNQNYEGWYPVATLDSQAKQTGELKLRFTLEEEPVFSISLYKDILDLLTVDSSVPRDLFPLLPENMDRFANNLLHIYEGRGQAIDWLQRLVSHTIEGTDNEHLIFRDNSLASKAIDAYMKLLAHDYLENTIGSRLRKICLKKRSLEIDPSRLEKGEDLAHNQSKLIKAVTKIWKKIEQSVNDCPIELRILFHHIQTSVQIKFKNEGGKDTYRPIKYTSVSGLLFLRLFCPAILNPKLFNLVRELPDNKSLRTLTLVAKTLQCLANLTSFGIKEMYMACLNTFIMTQTSAMMTFIDKIAAVSDSNDRSFTLHHVDLEKELAILCRDTIMHRNKIIEAAQKDASKEKLLKFAEIVDGIANQGALLKLPNEKWPIDKQRDTIHLSKEGESDLIAALTNATISNSEDGNILASTMNLASQPPLPSTDMLLSESELAPTQ